MATGGHRRAGRRRSRGRCPRSRARDTSRTPDSSASRTLERAHSVEVRERTGRASDLGSLEVLRAFARGCRGARCTWARPRSRRAAADREPAACRAAPPEPPPGARGRRVGAGVLRPTGREALAPAGSRGADSERPSAPLRPELRARGPRAATALARSGSRRCRDRRCAADGSDSPARPGSAAAGRRSRARPAARSSAREPGSSHALVSSAYRPRRPPRAACAAGERHRAGRLSRGAEQRDRDFGDLGRGAPDAHALGLERLGLRRGGALGARRRSRPA